MEETTKFSVTRENVNKVCDLRIKAGIVPTAKEIRRLFDRPNSAAIGVYLKEWKDANRDQLDRSPSYWRNLAQGLITKRDELQLELNLALKEISTLRDHLNPPASEE